MFILLSFFPGAEFAGWASIKPLAKLDSEKYGVLKTWRVGLPPVKDTVITLYQVLMPVMSAKNFLLILNGQKQMVITVPEVFVK